MSYGIEAYDENGNTILDNERLMHRFIDKLEITSEGNYYFSEYLDHKPTVIDITLELFSFEWDFIISNGEYKGLSVSKIDGSFDYSIDGKTLFLIFARE